MANFGKIADLLELSEEWIFWIMKRFLFYLFLMIEFK
jgi:hypothetical protein